MFADFADYHEIFKDTQLKTHLRPSSGCIHSIIALEAICIDVTGKQSIATENSTIFYVSFSSSSFLNKKKFQRQTTSSNNRKDTRRYLLELVGSLSRTRFLFSPPARFCASCLVVGRLNGTPKALQSFLELSFCLYVHTIVNFVIFQRMELFFSLL